MDAHVVFFTGREAEQVSGKITQAWSIAEAHASMLQNGALERYQTLQAEQRDLRRRLSQDGDDASRSSSVSSESSGYASTSTPPTVPSLARLVSARPPAWAPRSTDARRLFDVDNQIKSTLTHLLNCKSVKENASYRSWVQSRLMDTQMELRQQRRRRSEEVAVAAERTS